MEGFAEFTGKHFQLCRISDQPSLPYTLVKIALPPDADLASLTLQLDAVTERIEGTWRLKNTPESAVWGENGNIVNDLSLETDEFNLEQNIRLPENSLL